MLLLTQTDVESVLTMEDCILQMEGGFSALNSGQVTMPQRAATPIEPHNGLHLSMPAFVAGNPGTLTVKIVTVYPNNPSLNGAPMIQGVLLLHDTVTGKLLAIMDAEGITAMRTGAASGVATKYMARDDAHSVALFGAGAQASAQLEAVCTVRDIQNATIITRSGRNDAEFAASMRERLGIDVQPSRDVRSAVEQADIICTATNSHEPVFDGEWLQPGAHINAIGAYNRTMREVDTTTIRRSRIIVDNHTAALEEAGDIIQAIAESQSSPDPLDYEHVAGELGDVVLGTVAGRTSPNEITLFKSVGLAMQDAVTAELIYQRAVAMNIGQHVSL